ncbi:tripartite ATP-independent transporter DctP family solute receptor [Leeuwenhoekiella aestuarii]|uniref:Tripartite ATP-independent transporter DctP family solute receptor n=1 Tax=Leeuwenhoekiella aestuarii TaxID=2249426 RepID=A0A4Q0NYS4_9FLAO|nr:TRAP transporter substrate-binding protein [Leeuwenhoekiella aestuarii]RXG12458.1 tripartite ATP-independent transporter DctP family solute receptor [Leeuwenhoekiella aestuarii]RXG16472.1 tripartite ATP-independent transporter DctP family solute receptor [Leeuwenhoekiella aestuarii]
MRSIQDYYLIALSFVLLLAVTSCGEVSDKRVIKLAHGLDVTHPVHKAMVFMGERLEEKSGGKMSLDIYPSQQLGSERECLELLQIGSLGMTKVSTGVLENFAPQLKVFGLPFLFRDAEHRFEVLEGQIGEELLNSSVKQRLKGLTFYDAGSRSFYTKEPVQTPEDLKGLKLRVMESQTAINMVKNLGGSPTPIAWGELYTALQQGVVDGAENNLPSFYLSHHYEVCKYYIVDEHTALPDELLISTLIWDELSDQEQKWVKEAAMESLEFEKKIWHEAEMEALAEIKKAGVEVIYPDKEPFRNRVKSMYEEFSENEEMKNLIEKIQAVKSN